MEPNEPPNGDASAAGKGQLAKKGSFREGFGFGVVSFSVGAIIGLISTVAIARLYGITVIGEYALATAPTGIVWFLSTVRERPALVRAIAPLAPRDPRITGLFLAVFSFSVALTLLASSLAAVAIYFVFTGPLDQPQLVAPALAQLASYLALVNSCWMLDSVLSTFRAGKELFWIRLWQAVSFLALATGLSLLAESVWCLIAALAASWGLALIHRVLSVRKWMRFRVPRSEIRSGFGALPEIIRFGLKVTPGGMAQGLSGEAGTWILGFTSSIATVGAWNRTWTLGKRMLDMNYRMSEMLLPTLVERRQTGDRRGFDRALLDSMRYAATGLLLPAAAVGGAADSVMSLFGPGFGQASDALIAVMLVVPLTAVIVLQTQALLAANRPWLSSHLAIARLIVTVAASIPLGLWVGVTGAALGILAGCVTQIIAQSFAIRLDLSQPVRDVWPARSLAILGLAYSGGFAAARVVDLAIPGLFAVLPALAAGGIVYVAIVVAGGGVLPRDSVRFRAVLRRVSSRLRTPEAGAPRIARNRRAEGT